MCVRVQTNPPRIPYHKATNKSSREVARDILNSDRFNTWSDFLVVLWLTFNRINLQVKDSSVPLSLFFSFSKRETREYR